MDSQIEREEYLGYIIDIDEDGEPYIYDTDSDQEEEDDRLYVTLYSDERQLDQIHAIIEARVEGLCYASMARISDDGTIYVM